MDVLITVVIESLSQCSYIYTVYSSSKQGVVRSDDGRRARCVYCKIYGIRDGDVPHSVALLPHCRLRLRAPRRRGGRVAPPAGVALARYAVDCDKYY